MSDCKKYDQVLEIFEHWKLVMNHPNSKIDKKRKDKILQALKFGYSTDHLKQAIDGCSLTPFNMGRNDNGQRYDSLELILRDAEHIDRFINNFNNPPQQQNRRNSYERRKTGEECLLEVIGDSLKGTKYDPEFKTIR